MLAEKQQPVGNEKNKNMDDYVRCSLKSQSVSKVMIIIKSGLKSQNTLFKLNSQALLTLQLGCRREVVGASPGFNNLKKRSSLK